MQSNHSAEVSRLNKITKSFRSSKKNNRKQILDRLAVEINQTQNAAIKNWLVRFENILRQTNKKSGGAK